MAVKYEIRSFAPPEIRAADGKQTLVGFLPYDREAVIGDMFVEVIRRGFFAPMIKGDFPVVARYNHDDTHPPLGRTPKTLRFADSADGLTYEADLPATEWGREVATAVERGDVPHSSFRFIVRSDAGDQKWTTRSGQLPLRELLRAYRVIDVAPVDFGAYGDDSEAQMRSAEEIIAEYTQPTGLEPGDEGGALERAILRRRIEIAEAE